MSTLHVHVHVHVHVMHAVSPELHYILPYCHDVALQLLLGGESAEEEVGPLGDLVGQVDLNDVQIVC